MGADRYATLQWNWNNHLHSVLHDRSGEACSGAISDSDQEKSLLYEELMKRGSKAAEERDYAEAVDCYRRAFDIRIAHFGGLAPECINVYCEYGCALLEKYQETGGPEDKTDLDLAEEKLDTAWAIDHKPPVDTTGKVDTRLALAAIAWEKGDHETAVSFFEEAQRLLEPDSPLEAELYFRISMCWEDGSKPNEAIPHCKKAMSICLSRVDQLTKEINNSSDSRQTVEPSSGASQSVDSLAGKRAEKERFSAFCDKLKELLQNLEDQVSRGKPKISESDPEFVRDARKRVAAPIATSSAEMATTSTGGNTESPTVSTTHTDTASGETQKRGLMNSDSGSSSRKKPSIDPLSKSGDGTA